MNTPPARSDLEAIAYRIADALPSKSFGIATTQFGAEPVHEVSLTYTEQDGTSVRIVITKE